MDMDSQVYRAMRLYYLREHYPDFLSHLKQENLLENYLSGFVLLCQKTVKCHREWFFGELYAGLGADILSTEAFNEYHATLNGKIVHLATMPPQIQ